MSYLINYIKHKDYRILTILYLFSFGLITFNYGLFWDDWSFYSTQPSSVFDSFLSSGLPLSGVITNFILSLPFSIIICRIIIFLSYIFTGFIFYKTLRIIKYFDDADVFWLTAIFMVFPLNFARISFMNIQHAIAYFLFYLAVYLLLQNKTNNVFVRILSLLSFFISFNTNSFLVFYSIPIFFYAYDKYYINYKNVINTIKSFLIKDIDYFFIPFIYWFIKLRYFAPYGLFEDYNKINVNNIILSPIKAIGAFESSIVNGLSFHEIQWVYIIIFTFLLYKLTEHNTENTSPNNVKYMMIGLIMFYLAVLPYLFVGRGYDYGIEWGGRDQILIPISAAFLIYYSVRHFLLIFFKNIKNLNLLMSALLALFLIKNFTVYLDFHKDWFKQIVLIKKIESNEIIANSHNFIIDDKTSYLNGINRKIRFYEFNGMLKMAFNNERRLALVHDPDGLDKRSNYFKYRDYPEYNFSEYDGHSDPPLHVSIYPGNYKPTNRGVLKLIILKMFDSRKFNTLINELIRIEVYEG